MVAGKQGDRGMTDTDYEIATADGVDTRNHKRRPNMDWDIILTERKKHDYKGNRNRKRY